MPVVGTITTLLLAGLGVIWPLLETCRVLTADRVQREQAEQLLAYWLVFLLGRLLLERPLEACMGPACQWLKVALLLGLVCPPRRFHGAAAIHAHVLQPLLSGREEAIDRQLASASIKARATARTAVAVRPSCVERGNVRVHKYGDWFSFEFTHSTHQEVGRVVANNCLPGASRGEGHGLATALALWETARACLAPILAAATATQGKEEADIE